MTLKKIISLLMSIGLANVGYASTTVTNFENDKNMNINVSTVAAPDNYYPLVTKIVRFDEENDEVFCEDSNGFLWSFYGIEDWSIDDTAVLLMDNMGTQLIFDDAIVKTKYDSWDLNK